MKWASQMPVCPALWGNVLVSLASSCQLAQQIRQMQQLMRLAEVRLQLHLLGAWLNWPKTLRASTTG
jgi:hypothetical protein